MKIPYQLQAAVKIDQRYINMEGAIARGLPRLQPITIDPLASLSIACYGPSLRDTWKDLKHPILSMSGATRFLADNGVIADYHIDMDPRPHKIKQLIPPVPGVTYLIASVAHPDYFDTLKNEKVVLWHCVSSNNDADLEWIKLNDPVQTPRDEASTFSQWIITTGSNIGLAAVHLGGFLGYRHFEIHGMDGSYADDARHAGVHYGKVQKGNLIWPAGGKKYKTSQIMANGAAEAVNMVRLYPIFCVFHGEGLTQALIKEENVRNACLVSQTEKAEKIRKSVIVTIDKIEPTNRKKIQTWDAWEGICFATPDPNWLHELQYVWQDCEKLREKARYNTGSTTLETGMLLRALCCWKKPHNIIEVGTFIGKSTLAMMCTGKVYTCDRSNDCFQATEKIVTHPFMGSTEMFTLLARQGIKADVMFFDGRIQDEDLTLIQQCSEPGCVYAFDDYFPGPTGKGMANIAKLHPRVPTYGLVKPYPMFAGRSTLAMLVPTAGVI